MPLIYLHLTRQSCILQPVLYDINTINLSPFNSPEGVHEFAGSIYDRTVYALQECADLYTSKHKKGNYKFCSNQELDLLIEKATSSNKVWKTTGKPHSGPMYEQRKSDKLAYQIKLRECKEN